MARMKFIIDIIDHKFAQFITARGVCVYFELEQFLVAALCVMIYSSKIDFHGVTIAGCCMNLSKLSFLKRKFFTCKNFFLSLATIHTKICTEE